MKKLKMLTVAVLGIATTMSAHASSGVMDFEGFTITYESSGKWDKASTFNVSSGALYDVTYDIAHGFTESRDGRGVSFSVATANFGANLPALELQSYGGQGNETLDSTISYTVQAKSGWQLSSTKAFYNQSGTLLEFKGGSVSVSGTGTGSVNDGAVSSFNSNVYSYTSLPSPAFNAGKWSSYYSQEGYGNGYSTSIDYSYGSNGYPTSYSYIHKLSDVTTPLTTMTGSFADSLSVSTSAAQQTAYLQGDVSYFSIDAVAVRSVSPVPEPESYAMIGAGLAMIGFVARRKAKKAA